MVIVVTKRVGNRIDIIFIPAQPLNDMLVRHVDRIGLANRSNTCIVTPDNGWTGIPSHADVIKSLLLTINTHRMLEGEHAYPIPRSDKIRCKNFDLMGNPISAEFEGDFLLNLIRIHGGGPKSIAEIQSYELVNPSEREKILNTFRKFPDAFVPHSKFKAFVFLVHHLTPATPRRIILPWRRAH